jgi:Fe-S cluster assembly protein SufD
MPIGERLRMSPRTVTSRMPVAASLAEDGFPFRVEDVRSRSETLGEPAWLLERRLKAWEAFQRLPFPSTGDDAWRRTDVRLMPRSSLSLGAASTVEIDPALLQPLAGDAPGALLSVTPGLEVRREGGKDLARREVVFTDWASAVHDHSPRLERALGGAVSDDEDVFTALAASLAVDGIVVFVPAGVQVAQPLHSVVWAPGGGRAFFSRLLVAVEEGASVTLVHETSSPSEPGGAALHAGIVELLLGAGARLTFVELQTWGDHVWNVTHERATVGRDGRLEWIFGAMGSRLTKNFSELKLSGQGAEGRMSGFYFADGTQHLDHDTQQNHLAPHTTSDLLFKGALLGRSRSVWQGMIYVAPGAQKADGYQANRNLLLGPQARADSIPGLEILADDVRCTHGATVGQLEKEPIYYLMSRGLPRREAERLVVGGFFAPLMDRIPFDGLRSRLMRTLDDKLRTNEGRG